MQKPDQPAYQKIQDKLATDCCVILDGGVATELERKGLRDYRVSDQDSWGAAALYNAPNAVLEVHRRYVAAGCDMITTNTWGILNAPDNEANNMAMPVKAAHWMDAARLAVKLARQAVCEEDRTEQCGIAFSVGGDINNAKRIETLQLLIRLLQVDPPDVILLETLSLIQEEFIFPAVELVLQIGIPVWLSFRRCLHGICSIYGHHWGGPEGDLFGRAANRFEKMGVSAILVNCLPADHVPGILPYLRDFTDVPLGVYPNLGHYTDPGWSFDDRVGPDDYALLARSWRAEGAQIIGGCCGVAPEHIAAAYKALSKTKSGRRRGIPPIDEQYGSGQFSDILATADSFQPWLDQQDRPVYPLPFPEMVCEPKVFRPTEGGFLLWKYLFNTGIGKGSRCLEVGCGAGLITVQLALNGAEHVVAMDVQQEAVANTLTNCFRNGVSEKVSGKVVDLYTYRPEEKYDLIVANLYQMPVDPYKDISSHRPLDFWGRSLLDHFIKLLPTMLAESGEGYFTQLSVLSQLQTVQNIHKAGLTCEVVDFTYLPFGKVFSDNLEQIHRVEKLSDAFHLNFYDNDVAIAYLLSVRRADQDDLS